jgi:hypothetical protein
MTKKQTDDSAKTKSITSKVRTEADLESRLVAALKIAFPNISPEQFVTQHTFTVRLGHNNYKYDGLARWKVTGRADILIFHEDRPLAVLELKRENLPLGEDDYEQAQSYANQLTPRPPLTIITNGKETKIYDSNTGQAWSDESDAGNAVAKLLENAGKIAASDMKWAIEALMGREMGVWASIVRESTNTLIGEMTNELGKSGLPFARDLLFPRVATDQATKALMESGTFTIISGPPSSGKSNILRELAAKNYDSEALAILMLRGTGPGLFQSLANLFAAKLEWNIKPNEVRQWLRRMSTGSDGPALVIAIDGVCAESLMATDLEELANSRPGQKLKVILTSDQPRNLTKAPNGRTDTGLGTHSSAIELGPLGLEEFRAALAAMGDARINFMDGAIYSEDYRAPWILRTLYDDVTRNPRYKKETITVLISPSLGLNLIDAAREAYQENSDLMRGYRLLARDALSDKEGFRAELALAASNGFVVRQDALSRKTQDQIGFLTSAGWVQAYRHESGDDVIVPMIPAAFLVELADAAGDELEARSKTDPREAGIWLGTRFESVYLGDLAGAQAIRSMASRTGVFKSGLIEGLLSIEPEEKFVESSLIAMTAANGKIVHVKIENGKAWLSNRYGDMCGEKIDLGAERSRMYAHTTAWMILGLFASLPTAVLGDDDQRMDAWLLIQIGECPFPLLRVNEDGLPHIEHDLGKNGHVLCPDQGPVETTTLAIAGLLSRPWKHADSWIEDAIDTNSLPLMYRVMIALQTVVARQISDQSTWAAETIKHRILPAIHAAQKFHAD